MKSRVCYTGIFLVLAILYITGCRRAGSWLVRQDDLLHADAIVMLMGSIPDRILHAVDLFQAGAADKLLIVEGQNDGYNELRARGADMISSTRQVCNVAVTLGIPADSVILLSGGAKSTQHEAMTVKSYLADNPEIDTLLLVSSSPHMLRAYIIFKDIFRKPEKDICLLCSPSPYTEFNAKKWWKSKDDIETLLIEYIKLANFLLFERN